MRYLTRVEFDRLSDFLLNQFSFDDASLRHDLSPSPQSALACIHRPLVIRALKNATRVRRLFQESTELDTALEAIGLAVIRLDSNDRNLDAAMQATKLLSHYCPPRQSSRLPEIINQWIDMHRSEDTSHNDSPQLSTMATLESERGDLTVTLLKGERDWWLLLQERTNRNLLERLREAGLTAREAEVLLWVFKGKTNNEVAVILNTRTATIKKHLRGIYVRWGVSSRMAAICRARTLLGER